MCYLFTRHAASTTSSSPPLHDALPISATRHAVQPDFAAEQVGELPADGEPEPGTAIPPGRARVGLLERLEDDRSEEHTSELQSLRHLVCRLLLAKKNTRRTDQPLNLHR